MYWLDNSTGVTTPPTIQPVQSPVRRYFTEGGQGLSPSTPGGEWFNMVTDELLALLALANITPDKADHSQISKAIQAIAFSSYPTGAPIPWPTATPPSGFLAMAGQSFNIKTYPKLAIAYPSGVLPDLRGVFIRGWDGGRGLDLGRNLLSQQSDSFKSHNHRASYYVTQQSGGSTPVGIVGSFTPETATDFVIEQTGGSETRPINNAFYYITRGE